VTNKHVDSVSMQSDLPTIYRDLLNLEDVYVAIAWPSSALYHDALLEMTPNILSVHRPSLDYYSSLALLYVCYKHMSWIGRPKDRYKGLRSKQYECFPNFSASTCILFRAQTHSQVLELKSRYRRLVGIGYSSIHITDTCQESCELANVYTNPIELFLLSESGKRIAGIVSYLYFLESFFQGLPKSFGPSSKLAVYEIKGKNLYPEKLFKSVALNLYDQSHIAAEMLGRAIIRTSPFSIHFPLSVPTSKKLIHQSFNHCLWCLYRIQRALYFMRLSASPFLCYVRKSLRLL